jgi:flavodoxin I
MSLTIGIFVGSTYGNTESAAEQIAEALYNRTGIGIDLANVKDDGCSAMQDYQHILIGCSTWHDGKLQDDWENCLEELQRLDLNGKTVGIFGAGDQQGYAFSFQDALGLLGIELRARGAKLVGFTSTDGYSHAESKGVENGKFMGLALDYDNQEDLNNSRIEAWVEQIILEMRLPVLAAAA